MDDDDVELEDSDEDDEVAEEKKPSGLPVSQTPFAVCNLNPLSASSLVSA
jgi:hypothetical protein